MCILWGRGFGELFESNAAAIGVSFSRAATVAYFQDGAGFDSPALTNLVPLDTAYEVSDLGVVGFSSDTTPKTRSQLGTKGGDTPLGATADTDAGSECFFR